MEPVLDRSPPPALRDHAASLPQGKGQSALTAAEVDALIGRATAAAPALAGGGASATGAAPWWVPLVIVCVQGIVGPPAKAWARAWDGVGEAAEERARKSVLARRRKSRT